MNAVSAWFSERPVARWLAVVPGSLLSGISIQFPIHWVVLIGTTFLRDRPDGDGLGLSVWNIPPRRLEQFAIAALVPGVMIFVAGRIAPRYRFTTAVVAAALFAVGYASLLSYSFGAGSIRPVSPFLDIWLPLVLNAVGIGIGLRNARELPEPASPTPSFRMPL